MEAFTGASHVRINRGNFSNVGRDQYNYTTIHQTIVQSRGSEPKRLRKSDKHSLELSEFTEIKRGDIYKDKDVCYSWRLCWNGKETAEATVYYAEINVVGSFGQKRFTVKAYRGENAMKEWRRDFLRCSKDWDIPLFGYNLSSIPSLIFSGELVPLSQIEGQLGTVGWYYIGLLKGSLGCAENELWIDSARGRFCRGPTGPQCRKPYPRCRSMKIPSDTTFLEEDVVIRYLATVKHDQRFLNALSYSGQHSKRRDVVEENYPQVISRSTHSTIAYISDNAWWWRLEGHLDKGKLMPDGGLRFRLTDKGRYIEVVSDDGRAAWLSQAPSVFYACDISLEEDLSNYKFNLPFLRLKGTIQKSKRKRRRRQSSPPIYLFLHPAPFHLFLEDWRCYSWSLDPTGQKPLLPGMCKYLGIPFNLYFELHYRQHFWPTGAYKFVRDYQIARGFDPQTTDFARYLRVPVFEVVVDEHELKSFDESTQQLPTANIVHTDSKNSQLSTWSTVSATATGLKRSGGDMRAKESMHTSEFNRHDANSLQTKYLAIAQQGTKHSLIGSPFAPIMSRVKLDNPKQTRDSSETLLDLD